MKGRRGHSAPLLHVSPRDKGDSGFTITGKGDAMADTITKEEYIYQVDKIKFIVTPVYKEDGEPLRDILLKLMLAELEPA